MTNRKRWEKAEADQRELKEQLKALDRKLDGLRDAAGILKKDSASLKEGQRSSFGKLEKKVEGSAEAFKELSQTLEVQLSDLEKRVEELEKKAEASAEALSVDLLKGLEAQLSDLEKGRKETWKDPDGNPKMEKILEALRKADVKIDKLRDASRNIHKKVSRLSNDILYTNDTERKKISSFYEMYESPEFTEKYLKLISGLDRKDVSEIVRIIARQKMIREETAVGYDLFSREEKEKLYEMRQYMKTHTLQISDDLFCYDNYLMPVNHFEASVFYYKHGIECVGDCSFLQGKDILDVGGFYGDSVLVFGELPCRTIYSFEAIAENFNILNRTLELNGVRNCVPVRTALGDTNGVAQMETGGSASSLVENYAKEKGQMEEVPIMTLDSWMEQQGDAVDVGLIKVDIEGAEQMFLRGARKTIERFRPVMLLSIYHNASDFFEIKPLVESWDLGYRFKIYKPCDDTISREVLLICEAGR